MDQLTKKLDFYRDLGFFEQYNHLSTEQLLSNLLVEAENSYWGELSSDLSAVDWIILSLDTEKVWFIEDFMRLGLEQDYKKDLYQKTFQHLEKISNGLFQPKNLVISQKGYCSGRAERWLITFDLDHKQHKILFCGDGCVLVFNWLNRLNNLFSKDDWRFVSVVEDYGNMLILFLNQKQFHALSSIFQFDLGNDVHYWQDIGDFYYEKEDYVQAEQYYLKAHNIDQHQWYCISQLALCYRFNKKTSKMIQLYQFAVDSLMQKDHKADTEDWYLNFFQNELNKMQ